MQKYKTFDQFFEALYIIYERLTTAHSSFSHCLYGQEHISLISYLNEQIMIYLQYFWVQKVEVVIELANSTFRVLMTPIVTTDTAVHQIVALLAWVYTSSWGTFTSTRASAMSLHGIDIQTVFVPRIFESYSYSSESFKDWVPIDSGLSALFTCNFSRGRSRGVWHRSSELSPNVTQKALEQRFPPNRFVCQTLFEVGDKGI